MRGVPQLEVLMGFPLQEVLMGEGALSFSLSLVLFQGEKGFLPSILLLLVLGHCPLGRPLYNAHTGPDWPVRGGPRL